MQNKKGARKQVAGLAFIYEGSFFFSCAINDAVKAQSTEQINGKDIEARSFQLLLQYPLEISRQWFHNTDGVFVK